MRDWTRKNIPTRTRFEILKRDGFRCRYCGGRAPDAVLVLDHVDPVSKGGDNNVVNLVAACVRCNSGKSDVLLSPAQQVCSLVHNQWPDSHDRQATEHLVERALRAGVELDLLKQMVVNYGAGRWGGWVEGMSYLLRSAE